MLKEISVNDISLNPFSSIGKKWFLVTAGNIDDWNTMTAGWGFIGVMWGKNAFETVIRHNRYTFEFMEKNDLFTVCFLPDSRANAMKFCGSHSGRDCDKAKEAGITAVEIDGAVAFEEAELVLVCRKMSAQDFDLSKIEDTQGKKWYSGDPVHRQYIGEIISAYRSV